MPVGNGLHPPGQAALWRGLQEVAVFSRLVASRFVDVDDEHLRPMVVSVITQYRILKFIAVNVKETQNLRKSLKDLKTVGTFDNLQSASMDTPVIDVIHKLVRHNISSVPILDKHGKCINCQWQR